MLSPMQAFRIYPALLDKSDIRPVIAARAYRSLFRRSLFGDVKDVGRKCR